MAYLMREVSRGSSILLLRGDSRSCDNRIGRRALARLASTSLPLIVVLGIAGQGSATASPPANAFRFVHDADGRLKAAIDPEGETAIYGWDAAGNLSSISRSSSSKLSIIQLSPAQGAVGDTVKIKGTGFSATPESNTVKFNGTAATVEAATPWSLTVKVPVGATTGSVTVATGGEPVTSPESFTVAASVKPSISSLSPTIAAEGEEVTISGSNFESSAYENSVTLNRFKPALTSASTSAIKFKVPAERLGGRVSVATPQGSAVGPDLFVPPTGTAASKVGTTARISLGESKTVSLVGSEKVALVLFDGNAGEQVSLVASENTISGFTYIWSPSGSALTSGQFSGITGSVTLPVTGTYTILLKPVGSSAGSVKITSHVFEDQTGTIDPPATAEGLKQSVSLTVPGQNARFSVEVKAGDKFSLRTDNSNMTGNYNIKWIEPSGGIPYNQTWSGKSNSFWDTKTLSTAGTWTLLVDPEGVATGSVDLTLWETPDITGQSITPSTEGGSVTSTIDVPGQRELITFSGTAGQKVSWNVSESTFVQGGWITILKPDGSELSGSGGGFSFHDPVTLPTTGTYKFVLDPGATGSGPVTYGTGSLKLTAYTFEDVTGTIDPPATAEGLKQSVSLTTPGQTARYSVEVKAGDKFSLQTTNSNMTGNYYVKWLNPSGTAVHSNIFGAKQNSFWDTKTLSTAGTWTLLVDPEGVATGSVDLLVWETPDVTGQSITPSTEGGSVTSTINVPGQRELITFSGTAGQKVAWNVSENTIAQGGSIAILKPDGSELSGSNGAFSFHDPVTLPTTGTYKFVVDPYATSTNPVTWGTGSLKLTAYTFEDVTGTIDPPATAEGLKQSVSLTTPGQTARYSVTVAAGDKFSLRTTNSNLTGNYYVKWLNPSGTVVHSNYFGAKENSFWDTKTLSTAGTWTLLVDPEGVATGSVDLLVWETPDITGQSITPSTEGGSATSTINVPGQRELITFSGTASQLITFKAQESTIVAGTTWILKPDGTELSGSQISFTSSSSGKKEVTLPSTGTYTIVIDPPGTGSNPVTNGTGSVKVIVYLGSHVSWPGLSSGELQLVGLAPEDVLSPDTAQLTYSDIPTGRTMSSAPRARGAGRQPGGNRTSSQRASHQLMARRQVSPSVTRRQLRQRASSKSFIPRDWQPSRRAAWLPPKPDQERNWLVGRSSSPWVDVPPLEAAPDNTALVGQVLRVDGLPLAGVKIAIEGTGARTETGRAGRFLIEDLPAGHQVLVVNGEGRDGRDYGTYEIGIDLVAEETTVLDYTVWLTPLDRAGDLQVDSPIKREASLRTSRVPGLEVRMPAGTTITDDDGRAVEDLNITAIPLDRPPFPLPPFVTVPVYFTVQPGGASLSKGARFVYPNWGKLAPGERVDFWNYDPEDRGWYVYGRGTVTDDGEQVVPDPGVRVWEFTGAMAVSGPTPPPTGPPVKGPKGGDPVDLYTGLFTYERTDLVLPDTIPITIQRTYRPQDSNSYSFGEGTTSFYDLRLWPVVNYKEADLIFPDGGRVHFVRTSPGTGWTDAVYEPVGEAGIFDGSTISWVNAAWDLKLTNGLTYTFGGFTPLTAISDRFGNTLRIKRVNGQTGDILKITSPSGRWVEFGYTGGSKISEVIDSGGRKVKYTYSGSRLTKAELPGGRTTEYEYDGSGRMKAVINARGNKYLQNEYDANGRVKKQVSGDGGSFEFAYELDEAGKVKATTITDPLGNQRKVAFNSEGFQTSETEAPGTELAQTTTFEPQAATGLILSETDPLGRETAFEYDGNGNVKELTMMAGTEEAETVEFAYEPGTNWVTEETDPLGHTTKYEYGPKGQLLERTDALGHKTTFKSNAEGQLTEVTNAEGETTKLSYENGDLVGTTDPLGNTTSQVVDTLGRVRSIILPGGERYLYAYNAAGDRTSVTAPSGAKTSIEYDANGNPTAIIDPRSGETTMTYDSMDRLIEETDPLGKTAEWTYDKAGDLIEAVDRRGKVSKLSYDELRRLTGVSFGVSGETSESSIGYEYDEANRPIEVGDSASGEYALGYDNFDRLTAVEGPNGNVGYEYDDAGRRTLMEVPGGTVEYEYDNANRLTDLARGAQAVALDYDKADRLESLTLPNGIEQLYGYDKAGQATSIDYKDGESTLGEIDYAYDANGRTEAMWGSYARLGLPEALKSTKYNAANQLTEREGKALTYDADGNLTADASNEYTWNASGQLTKISGGNTASFGYDPFGRRASKTLGGTTTKLLYDGPNVVQESVGESVMADLLTGLAPDQLFSRTTEAGTSSYLTNLLGSTITLANGSAEVKTSYTYDPFGGVTKTGEATDNPYQFTGRENDGTGLQYNRARYYNPSMGRFISQDPAGFVDGANLYDYVGGAPLDFTDPTGEMSTAGDCCRGLRDLVTKIGDWPSCGGGVASGRGWDDDGIIEGALQGALAGGALGAAFGPGGFSAGALGGLFAGAGESFVQQWLQRGGCDRLAELVPLPGMLNDLSTIGKGVARGIGQLIFPTR